MGVGIISFDCAYKLTLDEYNEACKQLQTSDTANLDGRIINDVYRRGELYYGAPLLPNCFYHIESHGNAAFFDGLISQLKTKTSKFKRYKGMCYNTILYEVPDCVELARDFKEHKDDYIQMLRDETNLKYDDREHWEIVYDTLTVSFAQVAHINCNGFVTAC